MHLNNKLMASGFLSVLLMSATPVLAAAPNDSTFVHTASIANEFEIETSQEALQRSSNADIKTFAQDMIDDHTKAASTLHDTVADTAFAPSLSTKLDTAHQAKLDALKKLEGDAFDKRYIELQTAAHKDAVALFTQYASNGADADLKQFATSTLPTLKEHEDAVAKLD